MTAIEKKQDTATETARPFMAFAVDMVTRAALARVADGRGWLGAPVVDGGVKDAVETLDGMPTPHLLIIDLGDSEDPLADMEHLAQVCEPGTRVIALGAINDVQLYRALIDFGVDDYLVKPVSSEMLDDAVDRSLAHDDAAGEEPGGGAGAGLGRLIGVVGARGGVGASTTAVNMAWCLAREHDRRVALVDLDVYFGTVALALDIDSGRGFREALENPDRIDALFIERAMVRAADNLFVLAAEEPLDNAFSFDPAALDLLLQTLRADFDCVVIDLPRFAARTQMQALADDGVLTVVSDPTLAGLRDTLRLVRLARESGAELRTDVVINGIGAVKVGELAKADFERDGELDVAATIPFDAKGMAEAAGVGKTLAEAAKGSPALAAIRSYVDSLSPASGEAAKQPFWRRLLKGGA
jgi:pilus assembly protein CpaE